MINGSKILIIEFKETNKIRDLFKVKLCTIRSETKNKEKRERKKKSERKKRVREKKE